MDRNTSFSPVSLFGLVALRKESVDRNLYYGDDLTFSDVALRKESVDRNYPPEKTLEIGESRSPQGERG